MSLDTQRLYKSYLLAVLAGILAMNGVDRLALGLVLQNIKIDFHLNDTELGVLTGIAFALFYSVMGIPIGRWADRGNRVTIISLTAALWSVMVALSGLAANFVQLLVIRIGVAVGEAGCVPPSHSLIADYFDRGERPRAVATYMIGSSLSVVIGYFFAGWLNELVGWRMMFIILGLPGLIVAAISWFSLKEPRSDKSIAAVIADESAVLTANPPIAVPAHSQPSFKTVVSTLWQNKTFRHLLFCFAITWFFSIGIGQWQAVFFVRSFNMKSGEIGTWFAVVYGVCGFIGTYAGGAIASRVAAQNERLQLTGMALANDVSAIIWGFIYVAGNKYAAFALMGIASVIGGAVWGPLFATIQTLIPERMRAVSIALVYLVGNLIGMGLGPVAAGALSDAFRHHFGDESLRYALLCLTPGFLWASWHIRRARRTVAEDVAAAHVQEPAACAC